MIVLLFPLACQANYEIVDIPQYGEPPIKKVEPEQLVEERKSQEGEIIEMTPHVLGWNCVTFVKSKVELPFGLWTLESKKDLINTYEPTIGAVAITNESPAGHLALVVDKTENLIVLQEGNYIGGMITKRVVDKTFPIGYRQPSEERTQ